MGSPSAALCESKLQCSNLLPCFLPVWMAVLLWGVQHASASMSTEYLQGPCRTLPLPLMALPDAV